MTRKKLCPSEKLGWLGCCQREGGKRGDWWQIHCHDPHMSRAEARVQERGRNHHWLEKGEVVQALQKVVVRLLWRWLKPREVSDARFGGHYCGGQQCKKKTYAESIFEM